MNAYQKKDEQYLAPTYARFPICFKSGKGSILYDEDQVAYIDMSAGISVNNFGHQFEPWKEAIIKQTQTLAHVSNLYYSEPSMQLAKILCKKSGFMNVFFSNSGAEANEAAIKCARKYAHDKYDDDRSQIITVSDSFHGRTITTLSATGQAKFHCDFQPFTPGFQYVDRNNIEQLEKAITKKTCAIMVEVIQGEGGVHILNKEYLAAIQTICEKEDFLFIIDEIQSGMGRCGSLFAYELYGLHPHIVTCAKALGNGLPIGATLFSKECKDTLQAGDHGSTFGGNLIACAGAYIILQQMQETLFQDVQLKGKIIHDRLQKMQHVTEVEGLGMMIGFSLDKINANAFVNACLQKHILLLTAKNRVRLLPPLNISDKHLEKALNIIAETLENWEVL